MKKIFIFIFLISNIFAFESSLVKGALKIFSKDSLEMVSKKYGEDGVLALEKLSAKYGKNGLKRLEQINAYYGEEGIKLLSKYGEIAVKNRTNFNMIKKFGDKGFYLLKRFPQSAEYYKKFGDKFVILSDKYGPARVIKYLDEAKQYNADDKIIKFLDKFGEKANRILDKHWGKLLVSGFVLLNADDIIKTMDNLGETAIKTAGKDVVETANSNFGILVGLALILFVFLKYGWNFIVKIIKK